MADSRPENSAASSLSGGDTTELRPTKLIGGGRALAHAGGATWMVRGALPGELVAASPTRRRARVIEAQTIDVLADPHPARLSDPCPHAGVCGGCDWPQVEPVAGANLKRSVAAEAAARFPELAERIEASPVAVSPPAYRLRNRLHWDPGPATLGFFGHRSRRVAEISACRIITSRLARAIPTITRALAQTCPAPVDVETLEGAEGLIAALRPAASRRNRLPADWVPAREECLDIQGFHRLGREFKLLAGWGPDHVSIDLPVPLQVPLGGFFQGNIHLVPWLFDRVGELIGAGSEPVFDLHGGVGFLAAAAQAAGRADLTVVEPNRPAADAARRNLPSARVAATTAEAFLAAEKPQTRTAVVIVDPPRSGMTPELRRALTKWRPHRILTLGCDPATWARDVADLMDHGYGIAAVELADLFPFTHHVEIIAVLETR